MFYPGREILIGQQIVNAFPYCHIPMYVFSILFFLAIIILSISLLNKYGALFAISFYAFNPRILQLSRWIHVDIFGYFFIVMGLLFLWKAYAQERNRKEWLFFLLAFISMALAFATKLSHGLFLIFAVIILFNKYKREFLQIVRNIGIKLDLNIFKEIEFDESADIKRLIKLSLVSILSYIFIVLIPLYFNPKNLLDVIKRYQSVNPEYSRLAFNTETFRSIFNFLMIVNILDVVLFIFSLIILIRLIKFKKLKKEKFIIYLFSLLIVALLISKSLIYPRIFLAFSFGPIFLVSLMFSNDDYSIFKLFKIKRERLYFGIFIVAYVIFSFTTALSVSPSFLYKNNVLCYFSESGCNPDDHYGFVQKDIAEYLKPRLNENETFIPGGIVYYYLRQEQSFEEFVFEESFKQQFGRYPTIIEKVNYFKPNNRTIRYLVIPSAFEEEDSMIEFKNNFVPDHIIESSGVEATYIYDLLNLSKK